MTGNPEARRGVIWTIIATLALVVRILATVSTALCVIGWVLVAVRGSLANGFLWPSVASGAALVLSTYVYSLVRPTHPRHNGWIP